MHSNESDLKGALTNWCHIGLSWDIKALSKDLLMPFSTVRSSGSSYSNKKHLILQCWVFSHCINYRFPLHCLIPLHPISFFQFCTKGFYNREACFTLRMERVSILKLIVILYLLMEFHAVIRCLRHPSQCSKNFCWMKGLSKSVT